MMKYILIGLVVLIVLYVIFTYNSFIRLRTWISESWGQIDVQLRRRFDLIPNLVNTVKGYAKHEQETFTKVVEARNKLISGSPEDRMEADNEIQGALKTIFALSESYPELKADRSFLHLQEELVTTENKIAYARRLYNQTVAKYNIKCSTFPSNLVAKMFNFEEKSFFKVPEEVHEVPTVEF